MTQNIYDNAQFFAGYSQLRRSIEGLDGMAEWASLRALLPDLRGLKLLDLGCGFGWFCRWARTQGAAQVLGVDVSENMLARAAVMTTDAGITYARADMEDLDLPATSFDLAYSSLALHYVENLATLLRTVRHALVPGGSLIVSVEHPLFTAPTSPGWAPGRNGRKTWPVDSYLIEGPRTTDWLAKGVIKQHRTLGTYLNLLIRAGFTITHVEEWGPTDAQIAAEPTLADEAQRPTFLLLAARREG